MKIFSTASLLIIAGIVLIGAGNIPANAAMAAKDSTSSKFAICSNQTYAL